MMTVLLTLAGMVLALAVTLFAASLLGQLSPGWHLLDKPRGHRRHARATPMVGGLSIFFGLIAGSLVIQVVADPLWPVLLACALVLATGTLDDAVELPATCRFLSQALAATLLIGWAGARLSSLGNLVLESETVLLGHWSWPLSLFAIVGIVNAFNMADGIDGQCGSLSLVTLVSLCLLTLVAGYPERAILMLVAIASIAGFLITNLQTRWRRHAGVFLGDAGSTLLGLLIASYLILFSQGAEAVLQPVTALWLVAIPLMDTIVVMSRRLIRGTSPFRADREHLHHLLASNGLTQRQTTGCLTFAASILAVTGLALHYAIVAEYLQFRVAAVSIVFIGFGWGLF